MEQNEFDRIELRSEKVRNIIGKVPPIIIRSGIGILSILFFLIMIAMCFFSYSETVNVEAELITTPDGQRIKVMLPYKLVSQINNATSVKVEFEGYNPKQFGTANAIVTSIAKKPICINDMNYFIVEMKISECSSKVELNDGMKGHVSLLLSKSTFAEKIFKSNL